MTNFILKFSLPDCVTAISYAGNNTDGLEEGKPKNINNNTKALSHTHLGISINIR